MMLLWVLFALWTGFAWWAGWKCCDQWRWHCRMSERFADLVHPPSLPLPHPVDVLRRQRKAWENLKRVDQEWRA